VIWFMVEEVSVHGCLVLCLGLVKHAFLWDHTAERTAHIIVVIKWKRERQTHENHVPNTLSKGKSPWSIFLQLDPRNPKGPITSQRCHLEDKALNTRAFGGHSKSKLQQPIILSSTINHTHKWLLLTLMN
jgi:hypothetical protein